MRNLLEEKRDASTAWLERTNPLVGMSITDLQNVFDAARGGDTQRLHWIFGEIESVNPTLMVCVDRRASAISNFSWSVSERASMDGGLSNEQKDAAERFLSDIDNFSEALEHLDLAFFRGFAHVQPIWEQDGTVRRIALLDSWNFVHRDGAWYFNPACTGFSARDLVDCRDARLMSVVRANRRHIDYPALGVHVRDAVGNRDWGRFLERHALPKPAVTMHAGATENDRALYLQAAECVENGQVSVWPYGATLTDFAGGSRGVDPFSSFVKHQEETIVRLATGGTLGSIAESGAGTLAGNAQADVWRSIVRRDSGVLARAVMSALVRPYLRQAFPGKPCAVDFAFDFSERPTPKEVFEMQAAAKQGGYTIALDELEEATGFTLEKLPEAAPQGPFGGMSLNAAPATPFKTPKPAFKNDSPNPRPQGDAKAADASEGVLAAFAKDASKAAEAVKALLDDPTPEKAKALIDDLPNLIPDDPALAAVIAEEMAKEFTVPAGHSQGAGQHTGGKDAPVETSANRDTSHPVDAKAENSGTSEGSRKGWETRRKNGWTPEKVAENKVKIAALAKKALEDRSSDETIDLGGTDGEAVKDIKALTGIDVSGYSQEISTHDIRHEDKRHGPQRKINKKKYGERRPDQIPISADDYERIPELLSDYDNIGLGDPERGTGRPSVVYTKKYPDGVLYGVEVVIDADKKLHYKTGWKKKL